MSSPKLAVTVEQLAAPVPGGIGTYTRGLLLGLDQLGVSYETLGSRRARQASQGLKPEVSHLHLAHRLTTAAWHHGLSLRSRPSGVVHATSLLLPRVAEGVQRSVMVHDVAWRSKPELTSTRGARWHEAALSKVLATDAKIFVPSQHVADELALSGTALNRVMVVGEGADHLPAPDEAGAQTLLESAIGDSAFLLVAATIEPRKNLEATVAAFRQSNVASQGVQLCIVGPQGWGARQDLQQPGVHLLGAVSPAVLNALYARALGLVYLPLEEGFGLPPLEAMTAGTAVLASSAVPSVTEFADESAPAFLVDPRDLEAMAAGIHHLVSDPDGRAAIAEAGRNFAAKRRWVDVATRHLELWGLA